jgi:hypothetical protein
VVTPFLGPPREEWQNWSCGFMVTPGAGIHCNRDSVWHGFVLDDPAENIMAMMNCCDDHLPYMKLSADYVHSLKHPCGIPGSCFRWPENYCYTEWDETEEFTVAELVASCG